AKLRVNRIELARRSSHTFKHLRNARAKFARPMRDRGCALECLFLRMARTGDLAPMLAERKLLEQVGDVLAGRNEAHLDAAVRADGCDASDESQRIGDALAQIDFQHALIAEVRIR